MSLYSAALEKDSTLAAGYNNRALAHLKLNNLADAEADCGYVLRLEPRNVKAFLRRGSARYLILLQRKSWEQIALNTLAGVRW